MGLSTKKSSSTSNSTMSGTSTVTPTNPGFVQPAVEGLTNRITNLSSADPTSFIAGPDNLQLEAGAGAAGLTTSPNFGKASDIFSSVGGAPANAASGSSIADGIPSFMNPYVNDVVKSSLADYDYGAGQTVGQNKLALANDSTFGGSGGAIQTSMSNDALTRGRAALSSGLYSSGYDKAAALAAQQASLDQNNKQFNAGEGDLAANRSLASATGLTDTGTAAGNDTRSNITAQGAIGDMLRQIAQAKAGSPLALLAAQTGMLGSLSPALNLLHGSTTDTTGTSSGASSGKESGAGLGDWLGFFAANANAAAKAGA